MAVAPDSAWLATVSDDSTVRTWDLATGRQRAVLTGHSNIDRTVTIAPIKRAMVIASDGTWLAIASDDNKIRIWDPATGRRRTVLTGHTGRVLAAAVASDGTWLATGSMDKTVRIWDPATGRQRAVLAGHARGVTAVAVTTDGTWLATASDNTLRVWNLATHRASASCGSTARLTIAHGTLRAACSL